MRPIEALLEIARDEGVTRIFGNPGTTELPLMDALAEAPDLRYVLGLQEGSVVAMADGYARASRRTSLVSLHVAAGVANGLIGMLNALRSRTPMVIVAGQQDRRHLLQDPMLSGDLVGLASAATKQAVEVQHAGDLPIVLRRAFALAARPPAGPVLVSVPMDLLEEDTDVAVTDRSPVTGPGAAEAGEAAALLARAERPAIIAGDGVGRAGAAGELVAVAERLGAAVYHQPMNDGIDFPTGHPLYAGMLAPHNAVIRETLSGHDAVLIAGCHAFMPHHYTHGPAVPDGLDIVQVDEDPAEIGRNFATRHGLTGDLAGTLRALADHLGGRVPSARERTERLGAEHARKRHDVEAAARAAYGPSPMDPRAAAHAVAAGVPDGTVVVEEAITVGLKLRAVLRQDRPGSYVHTVGGGLGWGIGAAVGTRMADPGRPVVAVLGDGCAMFGLQGLWSAARYEVPVAFVVMNNGEYRTLKDTLDEGGGASARYGRYVGMDLGPPALDWQSAARLFGIGAVRAGSADELRDAVAEVRDLAAPLLIEAPVAGHGEDR
ncbi:thiamine pyrophosphate-binding protein [Actinomadura darangshiensis]|uniref:Thiamine pyrophosphate-binding protein n=1 Tax=Actinomadura darangshiensis TaxID=705336 RepID=A0A4R5B804_9ACTN|nr:thiamine pyrophosphate-binding protein [Actinomadura darangshiensis]TDD79412.1 thiamine pyrophosphate-binding protein [Actinomadura darangshiensis]